MEAIVLRPARRQAVLSRQLPTAAFTGNADAWTAA